MKQSAHPSFAYAFLTEIWRLGTDDERAIELSTSLGVSTASLARLHCGWIRRVALESLGMHGADGAWMLPMRDAVGTIIGVRLRLRDGTKLAIRGSANGLFMPLPLPHQSALLLVTEGESDTAALLDLGFYAIGRPGCANAVDLVCQFARRMSCQAVVVVSDNDEPGVRGATTLAVALAAECGSVRLIRPPEGVKDARAWLNAGATSEDVEQRIAQSRDVRLRVSHTRVGS